MSPALERILQQIEQLPLDEQKQISQQLVLRIQEAERGNQPKRKLSEFRGMVQHPFFGEDAQEWVTRTRREGDEHREQALRGEA